MAIQNNALTSVNPNSSTSLRVIDRNGEPWFVAADVCESLDLEDTSKAVSRLDGDEKLTRTVFVSGQNRETLLISESGLYSLILTSRKPEAKKFKKWVTSEVLPSIRKTGSYEVSHIHEQPPLQDFDSIFAQQMWAAEKLGLPDRAARVHALSEVQRQTGADFSRAIEYAEKVRQSEVVWPASAKLAEQAEAVPDEEYESVSTLARRYAISETQVNTILRSYGLQNSVSKVWVRSPKGMKVSKQFQMKDGRLEVRWDINAVSFMIVGELDSFPIR